MKRMPWTVAFSAYRRWRAQLSSRLLLATGLSSIVVCALLVADMAGLVPDRIQAQREGRIALAESVGLTSALLTARGDSEGLARFLSSVTSRNPQITAVRVRSMDGSFTAQAGQIEPQEEANLSTGSTDTRLVIPVSGADGVWGAAELRFVPLSKLAEWAPWLPPVAPLVIFLTLFCTSVFYLYLRRMLRHLDPSNAIPARVRTAFDTLAEGVLVLDPQGDIVLANRAFAAMVGQDADSLIGSSAAALPWTQRSGTLEPGHVLPWVAALGDGQLRSGDVLMLTDGSAERRTFMINSSPIPGAADKPAGVLVSLDDVTELEHKELELRLARDSAQAANRAKSDFLANMSHEIRTPMNAILGFTELLRRGVGSAENTGAQDRTPHESHQRYLNIIHGSGKHLLELINDILDLSKVEAGHLEVESVKCEVHQVVLDVARIMNVKADEKGIALRVVFDSALPAHIHSDPSRLRQVFTNLVGNAIKFTATGEVRISVRMLEAHSSAPQHSLMQIDIADSGIGIPTHRLESIFEPFVQAEASTTRKFGGTGLGLTISRRFARALGGDVVATSQPGMGSVFHVSIATGDLSGVHWLPPEALASLQLRDLRASSQQVVWRFPKCKVLVVDDGAENRELVRLVLSDAGIDVIEAENGAIALEQVATHRPDLVLMDIQMPVMDGSTATQELRKRGLSLPVLALTANAMKGFEREIESGGFTGHLTKPIDIDHMLATLATYLGGERVEPTENERAPVQQPTLSVSANTSAITTTPSFTPRGAPITSRLATHPRLARVARSFCEQLPYKLDEMQRALSAADFPALSALAHWLKGAGGTVGYDAFFEPARDLEHAAVAADAATARGEMERLNQLALRVVPPPELTSTARPPPSATTVVVEEVAAA
jgi:signal transduction histidine kinase/CheY-like chemotaxis protein